MSKFFINHTRKKIVPAEKDAGFNITKHLREIVRQYGWSLDDHIEFAISGRITHPYGVYLLIHQTYELVDWINNLKHFLNSESREYNEITLQDEQMPNHYARGPFGV